MTSMTFWDRFLAYVDQNSRSVNDNCFIFFTTRDHFGEILQRKQFEYKHCQYLFVEISTTKIKINLYIQSDDIVQKSDQEMDYIEIKDFLIPDDVMRKIETTFEKKNHCIYLFVPVAIL